jgi:hypothetical protein
MEHKFSKVLFSLVLIGAAIVATGSVMAGKVYRWVDENGEVHYSESLPPDFEDKTHDVLDEQGIVREEDESLVPPPPAPKIRTEDDPMELPRDSSGMERPKALYSEKELQERMDRFLLLRYDSEQEIADSMEVEIKQLEYDRRLLQKSRDSMYEAYRGLIKQAANRQRSGSEVEPEAIKSIMDLQVRLESNQVSLDSLKARESGIRETFNAEIERYRYLIETWSEDA